MFRCLKIKYIFLFTLGTLFFVSGCASLPFGHQPTIHKVQPGSFNSSDLIDWYRYHRYRGGYWFHPADRGTYLLVSLGQREKDYNIRMGDIDRNRYGNFKVDFSFDPVKSDTSVKSKFPHDIFLIQPSVGRNQLVIHENQRNTIDKLRLDKANLEDKLAQLREENKNLSKMTKSLEKAKNYLQKKFSESQNRIVQQNARINILSDTVSQQTDNLAKLQEKNLQLKEKLDRVRTTVKQLNDELKQKMKQEQTQKTTDKTQALIEITFGEAEYQLNEDHKKTLKTMVQSMNLDEKQNPSLSIVGSASPESIQIPELQNNLHLSFLRAWSVTEYLIKETSLTEDNLTPIASGAPTKDEIEKSDKNLRTTKIYKLGSNPVKIQ